MPIYIPRGSPEETQWQRMHPVQRSVKATNEAPTATVVPPAAIPPETFAHAAATGDMRLIAQYTKNHKDLGHKKDSNGWLPIHLAARGKFKRA